MDQIEEYWMDPSSEDYNEHVISMTHLDDPNQPYSCTQWAQQGSTSNNFMLEDGNGYTMHGMFNSQNAFPSNIWIDHTMTVYYKTNNTGYYLANLKLQDMLDDCEPCNNPDIDEDGTYNDVDNCPNDYNPDQADSDGDSVGDVCDDCHNLGGDINDDVIVDILDIVLTVNLILSGGINSPDFDDCQKGDADIDGNGLINILDVIQIINIVMASGRDSSHSDASSDILYSYQGNDLLMSISSDVDISGLQFNIESNDSFEVSLLGNEHIELWTNFQDGEFIILALDELMMNRPFDSGSINIIIHNAGDIDIYDIEAIVASSSGSDLEVNYSADSSVVVSQPDMYGLSKIYPNPFNPITKVEFKLPYDANIVLSVYDVNGREAGVIFEGFQTSGIHSYQWDASHLPSGVYYISFQFDNHIESMKAVLMK